jgi:hypothetical protein
MSADPTVSQILGAVAEFLAPHTATLAGRDAYFARVAANALAIVRRELAQGPAAEQAQEARLRALLGSGGDLAALNLALCAALRAGAMNETTPGLLDHLKAAAREQIAIDQPNYRSG